jgi:hypothetical protein
MPGDDGGKEGGKEGGQQEGGAKQGRSKNMTFPELMCCMWAALGTNERFSAGAATALRLSTFNSAYTQRVKWMKEQDKWRDQHNKLVTAVTPEESIQLRVKEITTKTKETPISSQVARVVKVCRNDLAPLLDKILDKDGKIPSGKQVSDMQEELRVAYFNSMTADNPTDPVSSEDEATKTSRLEDVARARANKLDKFHPMDLYIYFYYGPASVGGCASPYFLESAAAIQKAVKAAECTNRLDLRKRNEKEQLEKMQGKKARKLLKDCVDEMEECGPATSFGEAYGKQLELEEVRVETERSREQRENTQYLITMYQGLIAEATTPQEKSEYQAEVLLLMKQAVTHAKLKAHVASASTASTAGSLSSPSAKSVPSDGSGT